MPLKVLTHICSASFLWGIGKPCTPRSRLLISLHYLLTECSIKRGSYMLWEINIGVCPPLEFDNILFINCLGYDFYIYGTFEFLCNSIAL